MTLLWLCIAIVFVSYFCIDGTKHFIESMIGLALFGAIGSLIALALLTAL